MRAMKPGIPGVGAGPRPSATLFFGHCRQALRHRTDFDRELTAPLSLPARRPAAKTPDRSTMASRLAENNRLAQYTPVGALRVSEATGRWSSISCVGSKPTDAFWVVRASVGPRAPSAPIRSFPPCRPVLRVVQGRRLDLSPATPPRSPRLASGCRQPRRGTRVVEQGGGVYETASVRSTTGTASFPSGRFPFG